MGRVNFNGIVISLQSIVVHGGGGNLRECPLNRALHYSQCSGAFKLCLEDSFCPFLFNTYSQNVCSGLFHLISRASKWAERILTPLLRTCFLAWNISCPSSATLPTQQNRLGCFPAATQRWQLVAA